MKKIKLIFTFLLLFFAFNVKAGTYISGYVGQDTFLTKSGNPYFLSGNLFIDENINFTIEKGVEIYFDNNAQIISFGNFFINGSPSENVKFIPQSDLDSLSFLLFDHNVKMENVYFEKIKKISIFDSNDIFINNTNIKSAENIFYIYNSNLSISNSNFEDFNKEALRIFEGTYAVLNDVNFKGNTNTYGVSIDVYDDSFFSFKNGSVLNTSGGGIKIFGGEIYLDNILIEGAFGDGVVIYPSYIKTGEDSKTKATIINSKISKFLDSGIVAFDSDVNILNSIISQNNIGIEIYFGEDFETSFSANNNFIENNNIGLTPFISYESAKLNFKNNWWGDATGPYFETKNPEGLGNSIIFYNPEIPLLFEPWLKVRNMQDTSCCSSIFFIPGLEASRLYTQATFSEDTLWEPNRGKDVEELYLNSNGESLKTGIYTKDIIDEAFGFNIYKKFIEFLNENTSNQLISEWSAFPYDWRKSPKEVVETTTLKKVGDNFENVSILDEFFKIAENSFTGKVIIIGHSNGGLVGKYLISKLKELGKEDLVDKFIMVAVPQVGTPVAIAGLLHGDEQEIPRKLGFILPKDLARGLGENMKSSYTLLPSNAYFSKVKTPVITFENSSSNLGNFSELYNNKIDSFSKLQNFMEGSSGGRVKPSFEDVLTPNVLSNFFFNDSSDSREFLDNWIAPENVEVFQIAGWGFDTFSSIKYSAIKNPLCSLVFTEENCGFVWEREPVVTKDGDRTVVIPSATFMNGVENYYVNLAEHNLSLNRLRRNRTHADILEIESLQDLIFSLVKGDQEILPEFITKEKPASSDNSLQFSVHSPVEVLVMDSEGRKTGLGELNNSGFREVFEEIPGSYYLEFGEGKYVGVPEGDYKVKLSGIGSGTFTFKEKKIEEGEIVSETIIENVPVNPSLQAIFNTEDQKLNIDIDGDGKVDTDFSEGKEWDTFEYLEVMRKNIKGLSVPYSQIITLNNLIDRTIKYLEKGNIKQAKKGIENSKKSFTLKLVNLQHSKKEKSLKGWSIDSVLSVLVMYQKLLDNL